MNPQPRYVPKQGCLCRDLYYKQALGASLLAGIGYCCYYFKNIPCVPGAVQRLIVLFLLRCLPCLRWNENMKQFYYV